jgi:hypothetical protein
MLPCQVALFFGTGNQTPNVSAAVISRVFLDPDLRLFDYCPQRLLNSVPQMFAFPVLQVGGRCQHPMHVLLPSFLCHGLSGQQRCGPSHCSCSVYKSSMSSFRVFAADLPCCLAGCRMCSPPLRPALPTSCTATALWHVL